MKKRMFFSFLIILLVVLVSYFFIWPSDLQITFKANAISGVVNQSIKLWADGLEDSKLIENKNEKRIRHRIKLNNSTYHFDWYISEVNDSVSQVKVLIKDLNHSFANKVTVPFCHTNFEKLMEDTVLDLIETLKDHIDSFKVSLVGEDTIPSLHCAYISFKCKQKDKALKMMESYPIMDRMFMKHNMVMSGSPFIEVENWKRESDSIEFNFCIPILQSDSLPQLNGIKYKKLSKRKVIKAIYKGNFITSDRAWYALLKYSQNNGIAVQEKPIEFFHSNPNMGGDEKEWQAEVFLPIE